MDISDIKNQNLHQRTHPENFDFLHFYGFYVKRKVLTRGVPSKNSYLKVLPMDSLDDTDVFCTVPDNISTLGSKVMCF